LKSNRDGYKRNDQHLHRQAVRQKAASPHVIYAFGRGNFGMTTAPVTGKLFAVCPPSIDIASFSSHRPDGLTEVDRQIVTVDNRTQNRVEQQL
jgi:hypothetical protein